MLSWYGLIMTSQCWDRITFSPSSIIITYLMPVISTCQNPSYWQMCCPLASVENVLAAEWLWIKPQSLQPLLPHNAFTFVVWQVNVSWLPSEIFFFTGFDKRHLANWQWYPVHCNLYSALGIWAWNERASYRLKGKKKNQTHNPKPELTSMWIVIPGDKYTALPIKIKLKKTQNPKRQKKSKQNPTKTKPKCAIIPIK